MSACFPGCEELVHVGSGEVLRACQEGALVGFYSLCKNPWSAGYLDKGPFKAPALEILDSWGGCFCKKRHTPEAEKLEGL